ncbi:acylphosphatase [Thauera sp. 2A1]|uniref:acylphosphatase n=1 Tax=Thauera sp. 2A1 TaxID=2570191 RepID=UPI001291DB2A|nr:acylphosphatase [Thauera sp. 2A1]KAI5912659.1 acylphosphatase [Thauera sp. 2A1]
MPDGDRPVAGLPDVVARRLAIHGRVQGVWYRASAKAEAQRLGLRGWVRNRLDGSVEALVIGPPDAVEAFVAWACEGPPKAEVTRIDITVEVVEEAVAGFEQRPTA